MLTAPTSAMERPNALSTTESRAERPSERHSQTVPAFDRPSPRAVSITGLDVPSRNEEDSPTTRGVMSSTCATTMALTVNSRFRLPNGP